MNKLVLKLGKKKGDFETQPLKFIEDMCYKTN